MSSFLDPIGLDIQPRDLDLLRGLLEARVMTRAHAAVLHFQGSAEACKNRVQRLLAAGLLMERKRPVGQPALLLLSWRGLSVLLAHVGEGGLFHLTREQFKKRTRVSPLTLAHELDVMSAKAAFVTAVRQDPSLALVTFATRPRAYQFHAFHPATGAQVTVKPDGFVHVRQLDEHGRHCDHRLFVEVDRSTESDTVLANRLGAYRDFYYRGGMAERLGLTREDYRLAPFRVLVICKSSLRREALCRRLMESHPRVRTLAWFCTMAAFLDRPLGAIWTFPADAVAPTGAHEDGEGIPRHRLFT